MVYDDIKLISGRDAAATPNSVKITVYAANDRAALALRNVAEYMAENQDSGIQRQLQGGNDGLRILAPLANALCDDPVMGNLIIALSKQAEFTATLESAAQELQAQVKQADVTIKRLQGTIETQEQTIMRHGASAALWTEAAGVMNDLLAGQPEHSAAGTLPERVARMVGMLRIKAQELDTECDALNKESLSLRAELASLRTPKSL
jgi:hypothetical protein